MSSDWTLPEVVIRERDNAVTALAVRVRGDAGCHIAADHWHTFRADFQPSWDSLQEEGVTHRPIVVIDPEDREQAVRVRKALGIAGPLFSVDDMQAALRSLIAPPKPEEPKNYLAVARTSGNKRYWRWAAGDSHTGQPWRLLGSVHADTEPDAGNHRWSELQVVEILSEGVAP